MPVLAVGLSHHQVATDDLTQFTACAEQASVSLRASHGINGLIMLATCNRCELYIDAENFHQTVRLTRDLLTEAGAGDLVQVIDVYGLRNAVRHLFEVACGLDSMVVGESEIAGQVRSALQSHTQQASPALHRLFQMSLGTSKSIANATALGAMGRSVASIALDLVETRHGDLAGRQALLVGTGAYAGVVTADLLRRGAQVSVYSSSGRATAFARSHPVSPVTEDRLPSALADAQVLVACSGRGRRTHRITARQVADARGGLDELLPVVDLALGRDVSPELASTPGIDLIDLDVVGDHAPTDHVASLEHASELIDEAVENYLRAERARLADPAILAVRAYVNRIVDQELGAAAAHTSGEQDAAVRRSVRRVANALLHQPTVRAAASAQNGDLGEFTSALEKVFGIEVDNQ